MDGIETAKTTQEVWDELLALRQREERMRKALALIEHKADQALQGQYTKEQLLGVIIWTARAALAKGEKE